MSHRFFFFNAIFCLQMGGCCTNSTTLRLISNNGFHISEHGLAILFDIWNKLYYTRHIKYNWMDHLTGICFKNSHSSAFAWLSWYAGNEYCFPQLPSLSSALTSSPQFKSSSSLVLSLLYDPTLTSIHDCWKNHSFKPGADNTLSYLS